MASIHLKTYAAVTVTTTAAAIFTSTEDGVTTLIFTAPSGNAGTIYIGDPSVDASVERGIKLVAGATYTLRSDAGMGGGAQLIDLTNMWADATASSTLLITALKQTT